ncbi:signal transduction histidine kinase, partial [Oxalobacteraceae bacterium GrIS 2.11]
FFAFTHLLSSFRRQQLKLPGGYCLKSWIHYTAHHIVVDIPDGIKMDSYPGAIGQAITNLVLNSLIHGFTNDMKGVVSISAAIENEDHLKLVIADNGKGIPKKNLDRVFDPFFTTRMGQGGSGLGLNIVFNIVKSTLGGNIHVDSEEGKSTVFSMTIPLNAPLNETRVVI